MATLVNDAKAPGTYTAVWQASAAPSGIYFYRLDAEGTSVTKAMQLIK
jgi:hypothetical protein